MKRFYLIVVFFCFIPFILSCNKAKEVSQAESEVLETSETVEEEITEETDVTEKTAEKEIIPDTPPILKKIGTYKCGRQPKQVLFTPDDDFIIMPLLDENGFDIFDVEKKQIVKRINPPNANKVGFVEGLFIPEKKAFFISQMTTGNIYEYSYPDFEYKRTVSTEGTWSKFIVWSEEKQLIAVSNWVSNDISLIDYDTGTVVRKIPAAKAPRGLYFLDGGNSILSLSFEGGKIQKFDVETGKKLDEIYINTSAMRHVVLNDEKTKAFISDMYYAKIYCLDLESFKITDVVKVYINPNTIDLHNNRWLFVSSRGYNNPNDYTKRSPYNGKITVIDTNDMSIVSTYEGGNQPTGLDVSNNGKLLCSSNFQDANIDLYSIEH